MDLFSDNGIRSRSYDYADYEKDFRLYAATLAPLIPNGRRIQGATWCSEKPDWDSNWSTYIKR